MRSWWDSSLARILVRLCWAYLRLPWRRRALKALAARIDALERDMQIGLYAVVADLEETKYVAPVNYVQVLGPGAMWPVQDHRDVRILAASAAYAPPSYLVQRRPRPEERLKVAISS